MILGNFLLRTEQASQPPNSFSYECPQLFCEGLLSLNNCFIQFIREAFCLNSTCFQVPQGGVLQVNGFCKLLAHAGNGVVAVCALKYPVLLQFMECACSCPVNPCTKLIEHFINHCIECCVCGCSFKQGISFHFGMHNFFEESPDALQHVTRLAGIAFTKTLCYGDEVRSCIESFLQVAVGVPVPCVLMRHRGGPPV